MVTATRQWECLQVQIGEGVGWLQLDRPQVRNAFDLRAAEELEQAVAELERAARVIVLRGGGGTFSAGADLQQVRDASSDPAAVRRYLEQLNRAFTKVEHATVPVIAAVEGYALAGGFELLQCCDIVLVAEDAVLGDQHANFGLLPGAGGSQRLPKLIGRQQAMALLLSGDRVRGSDAVAAGLAYRAVPAQQLEAEVRALARQLAVRSRAGLARMKQLVNQGLGLSVDDGIALEIDTFCSYVDSPDPQEGLRAFAERRTPHFE